MLRSIADRLQGRLEQIARNQKQQALLAKVLDVFSVQVYGRGSAELLEATYDLRNQHVTVTARSKTTASDLLLRAGELGAVFRKNGLKVSRLIIR